MVSCDSNSFSFNAVKIAAYILLLAVITSIQCKTQPALAWSKAGVNSAKSFVYNDPLKSVYYYDDWITVVDAISGTVVSSVNVADVVTQKTSWIRISGDNLEFIYGQSKRVVDIARGTLVAVDTVFENVTLYSVSSNFRYGLFRLEDAPNFTFKVHNYSDTTDAYEVRLSNNVLEKLVTDDGSICVTDLDSIYLIKRLQGILTMPYLRSKGRLSILSRVEDAKVITYEDLGLTGRYSVILRMYDLSRKSIIDSLVINYPSKFWPSVRKINDSTIIVKRDSSTVYAIMHSPLRIVRTITLPKPNVKQLNIDAASGYIVSHDGVNSRSVVSIESGNEIHRSSPLTKLAAIEQFLPGTVSAIDEDGYRTICQISTADMYRTDHERTESAPRTFRQFTLDTFAVGTPKNINIYNIVDKTPISRGRRYYYDYYHGIEETHHFVPLHHYAESGTVLVGFVYESGYLVSIYEICLDLLPTRSDTAIELRRGMVIDSALTGWPIKYSSATQDGKLVALSDGSKTHIVAIDRVRNRVKVIRSFIWSRTNPLFVDSLYVAMTGTTGVYLAHVYFDWLDKRIVLGTRTTPLALWNNDSILVYMDNGSMALVSLNTQAIVWSVKVPNEIADVVIASDRTWIAVLLMNGTRQLFVFPNATSVQNESGMEQQEFSVNPNPAFNYISISGVPADGSLVSVYDVNGRLLYSSRIYPDTQIDISDFLAGTYFVVIEYRHTMSFTINR